VSAGSVYELGGVPYCACNMTLVEEVESNVFCIWAPRTLGFVWGYFGNWSTNRQLLPGGKPKEVRSCSIAICMGDLSP